MIFHATRLGKPLSVIFMGQGAEIGSNGNRTTERNMSQRQTSQHQTVVTRKGQITLPAEIRHALGLQRGDKVTVELLNGQATVKRSQVVIARTAGSVHPRRSTKPLSAKELREAGEAAWADEGMERNA